MRGLLCRLLAAIALGDSIGLRNALKGCHAVFEKRDDWQLRLQHQVLANVFIAETRSDKKFG